MAVSVDQRPVKLEMKRSNLTWVCSSSNSSEPGFKLLVEVKNGADTLGRYYISKNPNDKFIFNLRNVIEDFIKLDVNELADPSRLLFEMPNAADQILSNAIRGIKQIDIEFGEVYGSPLVEYPALTTEEIILLDGITPRQKGLSPSWPEIQGSDPDAKAWMTERIPNTDNPSGFEAVVYEANENDRGVICFINDHTGLTSAETYQISYRIFDEVGLQGSDTIDIDPAYGSKLPTSTDADGKLCYFGFLPGNLNKAESPFLFPPSSVPNWTHYEIRLLDATINRRSIRLVVVNDADPCKHLPAVIHWKNSIGGWDLFKMRGRTDTELMQKGKMYQKPIFDIDQEGFNSWSREMVQYANDYSKRLTLRSGIISIEERDLLQKMMKSDQILVNYAGEWIPVVPESKSLTSYEQISKAQEVTLRFKAAQSLI